MMSGKTCLIGRALWVDTQTKSGASGAVGAVKTKLERVGSCFVLSRFDSIDSIVQFCLSRLSRSTDERARSEHDLANGAVSDDDIRRRCAKIYRITEITNETMYVMVAVRSSGRGAMRPMCRFAPTSRRSPTLVLSCVRVCFD